MALRGLGEAKIHRVVNRKSVVDDAKIMRMRTKIPKERVLRA